MLRDAEAGSEEACVREWLIRGTESGDLVRQEVASMLPAALLDVQKGHSVLDMCASPGSKTTQLVERLDGGGGFVVANDASPLRCYTLVKRTASLGMRAASLVVTCHGAQTMPRPLASDSGGTAVGGFDRIVCDVPCTGDGTTRKHPEVFHRWEVGLALRQHPLQLQIAMRGAALLKVGGIMCYSTCSLNPIENEAVVAELLRRCRGAIRLVPGSASAATKLAGGCSQGMRTWSVLDSSLTKHAELSHIRATTNLSQGERRLYCASMWPPTDPTVADQLAHCVRLLPHRSDSGGFFVALLTKVSELPIQPSPPWPRNSLARPEAGATKGDVETDDGGARNPVEFGTGVNARAAKGSSGEVSVRDSHSYEAVSTAVASRLRKSIRRREGVSAKALKFLEARLFARSAGAQRVVYMTPACEHYVTGVAAKRLHVVHAGATVFHRRRRRRRNDCLSDEGGRFGLTTVGQKLLSRAVSAGG